MGYSKKMETADRNAEKTTLAIVYDLESAIDGSQERAVIMCNSALAAVEILATRYGIRNTIIEETYEDLWQPAVQRLLSN